MSDTRQEVDEEAEDREVYDLSQWAELVVQIAGWLARQVSALKSATSPEERERVFTLIHADDHGDTTGCNARCYMVAMRFASTLWERAGNLAKCRLAEVSRESSRAFGVFGTSTTHAALELGRQLTWKSKWILDHLEPEKKAEIAETNPLQAQWDLLRFMAVPSHINLETEDWNAEFPRCLAEIERERMLATLNTRKAETETSGSGARSGKPLGENGVRVPYGPVTGGFSWNETVHEYRGTGIGRKAPLLIEYLWGRLGQWASFTDLALPVWGDAIESITTDMVKGVQKRANAFFARFAIPYLITIDAYKVKLVQRP
jgi:hypothetical protein